MKLFSMTCIKMMGKEGISIEEVIFGENGLNKIFNMTAVMANSCFDRLDAAGIYM